MKEFENGEEFVFDGVKNIPLIGAVYSVPRTIAYAAMSNKKQTLASANGVVDNVIGTSVHILTSPLKVASAIYVGTQNVFGTNPPKQ